MWFDDHAVMPMNCVLGPGGARAAAIKRLHAHGPTPPRAHDLRQTLRVVLAGHLHLERGAGLPRVKADDIQPSAAWLMHKPRHHRTGHLTKLRVRSRMPSYCPPDLLGSVRNWPRQGRRGGLFEDANCRQPPRDVQTDGSGHRTAFDGAIHQPRRSRSPEHRRPVSPSRSSLAMTPLPPMIMGGTPTAAVALALVLDRVKIPIFTRPGILDPGILDLGILSPGIVCPFRRWLPDRHRDHLGRMNIPLAMRRARRDHMAADGGLPGRPRVRPGGRHTARPPAKVRCRRPSSPA